VGLLLSAAFGYLLEWAFYSYLYERDHLQQVLMTYALILVFEEAALAAGGQRRARRAGARLAGRHHRAGLADDLPGVPAVRVGRVHRAGHRAVLVVNRTRLGMMIRAGASNRDMVRGLGVDITRLYRIVFAGGVALAALAGMIAAPMSSVYPGMGGHVLIISFVVVVIGGIGSISGALIASLLVGVVDTFGKVFFAELSGIGVYLLMAVILVWRPEGLMKRGY
jgi:branched-chain amino acid transport system permease protein